jgi:hypothetical protein
MTTTGTAIAAARAQLDIPDFLEMAAPGEVDAACVVLEKDDKDPVVLEEDDKDPVVLVAEDDEDPDEPEVAATPTSMRVKLNPLVTTLPFESVLVCESKLLTVVAALNPTQNASASERQVAWSVALSTDPAMHCANTWSQMKFGIVLV